MEDIRLGRELAPAVKPVPVAAGGNVALVEADPMRTRLVLSTAGGALVLVGPRSLPVTATQGFALSTASPQMTIAIEVWGKLVQGPWDARVGAGTEIVSVLESTLQREK